MVGKKKKRRRRWRVREQQNEILVRASGQLQKLFSRERARPPGSGRNVALAEKEEESGGKLRGEEAQRPRCCQKKEQPSTPPNAVLVWRLCSRWILSNRRKTTVETAKHVGFMAANKKSTREGAFFSSRRRDAWKRALLSRRAPSLACLLFSRNIRTRLPGASGSAGVSQRLGRVVQQSLMCRARAQSRITVVPARFGEATIGVFLSFFFFLEGDREVREEEKRKIR